MSLIPSGLSVQEAYRRYRNGQIVVNRKYQRKLVWTQNEKRMLIDSILHEYPIPLILFAETQSEDGPVYEILDGMQRLNAIFDFIENKFDFNGKFFDVNQLARAKQLKDEGIIELSEQGDVLEEKSCANFLDYQLAVTSYQVMSEETIIEVFGRINSSGKRLSNQERRQAGVTSKFSDVVRNISAEIRGDATAESVLLYNMPEISIGSNRINDTYGLKAESTFWVKQGVLAVQNLRDSEDEEMLADIVISVLFDKPFARSKELLDDAYSSNSSLAVDIENALMRYKKEKLISDIKNTFSVLKNTIERVSNEDNFLRKTLYPDSSSTIKNAFYTLFMAFYNMLVKEDLSPCDNNRLFENLKNLQSKIKMSTHYTNIEDRKKNIALTEGLIRGTFVKKEPSSLNHGAGLALDFENSIRRSKIETPRYEFKQGFLRLSDDRKYDKELESQIIHTICAMANIGPDSEGYIYIGVADKEKDAERIKILDGIEPMNISNHFVVGVEREAIILGISVENYCRKVLSIIQESKLSKDLKIAVLTKIDIIDYKGLTVIRICVPKQDELSYCGEDIYIRQYNNTVKLETAKEILAVNKIFEQR